MALVTQNVTGYFYFPDETPMAGAYVTFQLDNDTQEDGPNAIPNTSVTSTLSSLGYLDVDLWPNERGTEVSSYKVTITYEDQTTGKRIAKKLNSIQVPDSVGPHDIGELLGVGSSTGNPGFYTVLTQAEYDALLADIANFETELSAITTGNVPAGSWDASSGSFPSGSEVGTFYIVSVAGTVDSVEFFVEDRLYPLVDSASTSVYSANWVRSPRSELVPVIYNTFSALSSSLEAPRGEGAIWTTGEGFLYKEASASASDYDVLTSAGVKLYATPVLGKISALQVGAKGDGSTDDSDSLNTLFQACRRSGATAFIPETGSRYIVTKSLNATGTAGSGQPLDIQGSGPRLRSRISATLTEAYPVLDLTDNKRATVSNILIETTATSLDTCTVLTASTGAATGTNLTFNSCRFDNISPNARYCVFGLTPDQLKFTNRTEVQARGGGHDGGVYIGDENRHSITSKFKTIASHGGDLTYVSASDSEFLCQGGYAMEIEEYANVFLESNYFGTLLDGHADGILKLESGSRIMVVNLLMNRCEDNGGAGTSPFLHIVDQLDQLIITGTYSPASAALIKGPGGIQSGIISTAISGPVFSGVGPLRNVLIDISAGTNALGTFGTGALASSSNVTVRGRVGDLSAVRTALAAVPGLMVEGVGGSAPGYASMRERYIDRVAFPRADTPLGYRPAWRASGLAASLASYTGGSGLGEIDALSIPSAVLHWAASNTGQQAFPELEVLYHGSCSSSWAASGQIQLQLRQGATTVSLNTLSSVPAGAGEWTAKTIIFRIGSGSTTGVAHTTITHTQGGAPIISMARVSLSAIDFADTTALEAVLRINNATTDPVTGVYTHAKG